MTWQVSSISLNSAPAITTLPTSSQVWLAKDFRGKFLNTTLPLGIAWTRVAPNPIVARIPSEITIRLCLGTDQPASNCINTTSDLDRSSTNMVLQLQTTSQHRTATISTRCRPHADTTIEYIAFDRLTGDDNGVGIMWVYVRCADETSSCPSALDIDAQSAPENSYSVQIWPIAGGNYLAVIRWIPSKQLGARVLVGVRVRGEVAAAACVSVTPSSLLPIGVMGDVNSSLAQLYARWGYSNYIDFDPMSAAKLSMLKTGGLLGTPSFSSAVQTQGPDAGCHLYFTEAAPILKIRNASNLFGFFLEDEPDGRPERCKGRSPAQVLRDVQRAATVCEILAPERPTIVTLSESALHQERPPISPPKNKILYGQVADILVGHEYGFAGGNRDDDVWSRRLVQDLVAAAKPKPSMYILEGCEHTVARSPLTNSIFHWIRRLVPRRHALAMYVLVTGSFWYLFLSCCIALTACL